jgi:O-antigen/teichoic acid export membrane protein
LFIVYGLSGALFALFPIYLITVILGSYWLDPKIPKIEVQEVNSIKIKEILKFTTPLYIETAFSRFRIPALIFVIAYFSGITSEIGYVFIAITLTEMVVLLLLIITKALYPTFVMAFSKNDIKELSELLNHNIRYASMMALFAIPIIFFLADPIVSLVLGSEYLMVGTLWKIISSSLIAVAIGAPYRRLALIYKRTEINQAFGMILFILTISFTIILLPLAGIVGMSYGYAIAYSLPLVFTTIVLFRLSRIKINFLNILKVLVSAIISFSCSYFFFSASNYLATAVFTVLYLTLLFLTGVLRKRDVSLIRMLILPNKSVR